MDASAAGAASSTIASSAAGAGSSAAAEPQAANKIEPITKRLKMVILFAFIFSPQIF
jgi:hypothetical protein